MNRNLFGRIFEGKMKYMCDPWWTRSRVPNGMPVWPTIISISKL